MIRITAKREGFRRAGMVHPATPTDFPDNAFTAAQLAQLKAEPMLVVEEVDDKPAGKSAGKTTAPKDGQ